MYPDKVNYRSGSWGNPETLYGMLLLQMQKDKFPHTDQIAEESPGVPATPEPQCVSGRVHCSWLLSCE